MFCTTSETEGEIARVKLVLAPKYFINDRSKAIVFVCVRFSVTFHLICVHIILSFVRLLNGHFWEIAAHSFDIM